MRLIITLALTALSSWAAAAQTLPPSTANAYYFTNDLDSAFFAPHRVQAAGTRQVWEYFVGQRGTEPPVLITQYEFDPAGRLTRVTACDVAGTCSPTRFVADTTGSLTELWNEVQGQPRLVLQNRYAGGRLAQQRQYYGPDDFTTTTYRYAAGRLAARQEYGATGTLERTTQYGYDARGRLTTETGRSAADSSTTGLIRYQYDAQDRPRTTARRVGGQQLTTVVAYRGAGATITKEYTDGRLRARYATIRNRQGRVKRLTFVRIPPRRLGFAALVGRHFSPHNNRRRRFRYDRHGNCRLALQASNPFVATERTVCSFDAHNRLTRKVVFNDGHRRSTWQYTYP